MFKVGDGRGFVIDAMCERYVITAAHCLPHIPPANGLGEDVHFENLIGPIGGQQSIPARCVFADPISDLAVLAAPDPDYAQDGAYALLLNSVTPYEVGSLTFKAETVWFRDGSTAAGPPTAESDAWMLSLDGRWFRCHVTSRGRFLSIDTNATPGMSGSPIVAPDGRAIGVVSTSFGDGSPIGMHAAVELRASLPSWLLTEAAASR